MLAIALIGDPRANPTFRTWNEVLDHVRRGGGTFASDGTRKLVADFFETDRGRTISVKRARSRSRYSEKTDCRLEKAIRLVAAQYTKEGSPLSRIGRTSISAGSDGAQLFGSKIEVDFVRHAIERMDYIQTNTFISKLLDEVRPDIYPRDILRTLPVSLFDHTPRPPHPIFSSVDIFDPLVLPSEFFLYEELDAAQASQELQAPLNSYDLYAVIREPRGWQRRTRTRLTR